MWSNWPSRNVVLKTIIRVNSSENINQIAGQENRANKKSNVYFLLTQLWAPENRKRWTSTRREWLNDWINDEQTLTVGIISIDFIAEYPYLIAIMEEVQLEKYQGSEHSHVLKKQTKS